MKKNLTFTKIVKKSGLKGSAGSSKQKIVSRDNHLQNIWGKLKFSCELGPYGTGSISIFWEIFCWHCKNFNFVRKILELLYNSRNFWDFPDFSWDRNILCPKSFRNSWNKPYIPGLLLIPTLLMTFGERKSHNIMKMIVSKILVCFLCFY